MSSLVTVPPGRYSASFSSSALASSLMRRRSTSPSRTYAPTRSASRRAAPWASVTSSSRARSPIQPSIRAAFKGAKSRTWPPSASMVLRISVDGAVGLPPCARSSVKHRALPGAIWVVSFNRRSRLALSRSSQPGWRTMTSVPPPNSVAVAMCWPISSRTRVFFLALPSLRAPLSAPASSSLGARHTSNPEPASASRAAR